MFNMHRLMHVNHKIKRLLSHSSESFLPFLTLMALQTVLSVWSLFIFSSSTEASLLASVTSSHFPAGVAIPVPTTDSTVLPFIGLFSMAFGILLWLALIHIGYDLEKQKVHLDETSLIGAACGMVLGAVSLVIPTAIIIQKMGSSGILLIAPMAFIGIFGAIVFGLVLVGLGALVKRYVLTEA
jgi:hypothetical protein